MDHPPPAVRSGRTRHMKINHNQRIKMRPPGSPLVLTGTIVRAQEDWQRFEVEFDSPFNTRGALSFQILNERQVVDRDPITLAGIKGSYAPPETIWEVLTPGARHARYGRGA